MARTELEVQTRLGTRLIDTDKVIIFPRGLMGFEDKHRFTLLQLREGSPFLVLQSLEDPTLGLLVADPYSFLPDYRIRVGDAEQRLLGVTHVREVAVLVTVSIPEGKPEKTALNLVGPILINHPQRLGLQVPQADCNFPPQVYLYRSAEPKTRPVRPAPPTPDTAQEPGAPLESDSAS